MTDEQTEKTEEQMADNISRVSVKVPPFWKPDPRIWFLQIEAQFRNSGITQDQTKFDMVISTIEADVLSQVSDVLCKPPDNEKYETLKKRLIAVFADSETGRIQKLLTDLELGDKKPSQLLREMQNLAGDKVSGDFLKTLWLQRLPLNMRSILTISTDELPKIADMADKIWEMNSSSFHANSVEEAPNDSTLQRMQQQISELSLEIAKLRGRSRHKSQTRSRDRSNYRRPNYRNVCYYHAKFGDRAFKCVQPCSMAFKVTSDSEN